jgi:ubiquitin conjugation factor E4 B
VMMDNPVVLPSGNKIDLNMLTKHLLNDPTDPYTRQAMKLEDVTPDTELKQRID